MKGLREFLEALKQDEGLLSEVEKVQGDAAKVVEIAKKNGYSFTEDEYNDAKMDAVSGGDGGDILGLVKASVKAFIGGGTTQGQGAGGQYQTNPSGFQYYEQNGQVHAYNPKTGQHFVATGWQ